MPVVVVANPKGGVGKSTLANHIAGHFAARAFLDQLGMPVLGYLRDTQNYVHLAARGLTLFDQVPSPVEKDLAQWERIGQWLEN